jgi:hypothetical protein
MVMVIKYTCIVNVTEFYEYTKVAGKLLQPTGMIMHRGKLCIFGHAEYLYITEDNQYIADSISGSLKIDINAQPALYNGHRFYIKTPDELCDLYIRNLETSTTQRFSFSTVIYPKAIIQFENEMVYFATGSTIAILSYQAGQYKLCHKIETLQIIKDFHACLDGTIIIRNTDTAISRYF